MKRLKDQGDQGFYYVEGKPNNIRAIDSGEKRPPKKGEYYLSGVPVQAWLAHHDLRDSFHIARLVEGEEIKTFKIKRFLP